LTTIINLICAYLKHHSELHYAQAIEIAHMVATGKHETREGPIKSVIYIEVELLAGALILILFAA
jgi:hypothetical protein